MEGKFQELRGTKQSNNIPNKVEINKIMIVSNLVRKEYGKEFKTLTKLATMAPSLNCLKEGLTWRKPAKYVDT